MLTGRTAHVLTLTSRTHNGPDIVFIVGADIGSVALLHGLFRTHFGIGCC